jgi:hypothetical protein
LYRLQRRADVDTSDLSASQQGVLRGYLQYGGGDAADRLDRKSNDEIDDFTLGGLCGRAGSATAYAALQAERTCDLTDIDGVDDDLDRDLGEALAKYDADGDGFGEYLRGLDPAERQRVLEFASKRHGRSEGEEDYSGADIIVKSWQAKQEQPTQVPSVASLVEKINYLENNGIDIYSGTYSRLTHPKTNSYKGGSYEIELAEKLVKDEDQNLGTVTAIGKKVGNSDGDILIDTDGDNEVDLIVEAKNYDFDGKYKQDIFADSLESSLKDKADAYRSEEGLEGYVLSFREDSIPDHIDDIITDVEDAKNVEIQSRHDEEYVK